MPSADAHGLGPLLERSLDGDHAARNDLFGRLRPYLKAQVRSWLGGDLARRLDESSLAQESLLRIEKGWHDFRGRSVPELLGWVRRIAYHVTLDRKKGLVADPAAADLQDLPGGGPSPLDAVVNAEEALRLAAALEQLPEPRRAVIVGRLIDGLPFEELARQMGKTSGALRVLFKRAVEQLRQVLGDEP
ncbi:MAG TPA: sigma-70 family RNA polymerase sigma factor [Gemmataceae bacterium]|nr:sigma-70 family RNA polymerase sigma factor [Gemmataceae bacterium]